MRGRRFVSGHNLNGLPKSVAHRAAIGAAQRIAWLTKRKRKPLGSTYTDVHGYTRVKVVEGKGRWVMEHIMVMSELIGRPVSKEEVVHHVNGCRSDNRPENLFLCRDRAHHNAVHRSQVTGCRVARGSARGIGGVS